MTTLKNTLRDSNNGLDYTMVNGYYLPNLTVAAPTEQHPTGTVLLRGFGKLGHEAGRRRRSPENADYRICGFRPALHSDSCYRQNLLFR